ncbi:IAA-alanine resistance protein 1 isoform X2 [Abrus precatorius]|uniref:IAA-alanine resistance protein 1 isoform X2 n=1 Tax=Abrus precatorius TaxID=3816 RepID=A0A8B8KF52_ABRPR|nr:IAA-alanine resistance protein 1 isoform X2 [Abrus precatorius]
MALLLLPFILLSCLDLGIPHPDQGHSHSVFCASNAHHHHHEPHHHHHCGGDDHVHDAPKLPEEIAEEEDMKLYGFGVPHHHDHDHDHLVRATELSGLGLWLNALGCSFLAGAMLGDAFLHQLPHAFGGEHSHSHGNHGDHDHDANSGHGHSHSLADLSTGISILAGIVLFLLVEKVVRYVEENSGGANSWTHGHHHHNHQKKKKLKDDNKSTIHLPSDKASHDSSKGDNSAQSESSLRKRVGSNASKGDNLDASAVDGSTDNIKSLNVKEPVRSPTSLVFGYLNLFSDGVHNFTDGMALGSAFMLYGSVGGWSRTLFLLAHELPQEVGDFGILIRSGFSIPKALFFNFLSALVALAGTALALLWGKDPGQSSLIEGFTAGGFIYIAIAGVLAEMNSSGNTTLRSTIVQIISLTLGMAVALGISLVE